jgi:glyoxylase-like metal-dependent hydrolase (beta-lactamase superfamily II)
LRVERVVVGALEVNCYIVLDEKSKEGIVIDPGAEGRRIVRIIEGESIILKYIINTHGHVDHIGANRDLKNAFPDALLAIGEFDLPLLRNAMNSYIAMMVGAKESPEPDLLLKEGDIIEFGECTLKVIHTPGHTPGSICLLTEGIVFTGDTLFAGSIGRVDLPMSQPEKLIPSIKEKLMILPDDTVVLPGHGPKSTIGYERRYNPFVTGTFLLF